MAGASDSADVRRTDAGIDRRTAVRRSSEQVFNELQRLARAEGRTTGGPVATQAYLTRHILESFLARLAITGHARQFVLKGGLLMGAYAVRRPTKDVDSNAIGVRVSEESLTRIAREVAALDVADGVVFDAGRLTLETIREQVGYRGTRLRMPATISSAWGELA